MSRINVDESALKDPRFLRLGMLLGCPREFALDLGRGRMEHLWSYCTDQGRHCLEAWEVEGLLGEGSAQMLVAARLATETPEGFYIAGTKGRIEWLKRKRDAFEKAQNARWLTNDSVNRSPLSSDNKEQEDLRSYPDPERPARTAQGTPMPLTLVPPTPQEPDPALEVYALFPRKEGKTPGVKRLRPQLKSRADAEACKRAAQNYADRMAAEGREVKHVKLFSTWVGEWRDWVEPEVPQVAARASPAVSQELLDRYVWPDETGESA